MVKMFRSIRVKRTTNPKLSSGSGDLQLSTLVYPDGKDSGNAEEREERVFEGRVWWVMVEEKARI